MDVEEENSLVSEEDSCDGAFQKLTEIFLHKSKGKSKATASPKRTRRHAEIGPSGQAYTPLELQVEGHLNILTDF
jgi:DNA mismatch repair protein MSH3